MEARTKADIQKIETIARAEAQRTEAEARAASNRLAAESAAETERIRTEAEIASLRRREEAAAADAEHPALIRLIELETLKALAGNANARLYIDMDRRVAPEGPC